MLLTFSKDEFVQKIQDGTKIHSIRADPHKRWKVGMKIHMWRGNPRNVTKNPYQFSDEYVVKSIQEFEFKYQGFINGGHKYRIIIHDGNEKIIDSLFEGNELTTYIAIKDGFETGWDFIPYFLPGASYDKYPWGNNQDFKGRIIHWTDFKY